MVQEGDIFLSEEIQNRLKTDQQYIAELADILQKFNNPLEALKIDRLNPKDQAERNMQQGSQKEGKTYIVRQYASSQGRVYAEMVTYKKGDLLRRDIMTDFYMYSPNEYETEKNSTKFITFDEWKDISN